MNKQNVEVNVAMSITNTLNKEYSAKRYDRAEAIEKALNSDEEVHEDIVAVFNRWSSFRLDLIDLIDKRMPEDESHELSASVDSLKLVIEDEIFPNELDFDEFKRYRISLLCNQQLDNEFEYFDFVAVKDEVLIKLYDGKRAEDILKEMRERYEL